MSAPVIAARRVLHPGKVLADRVTTAMGARPRRAIAWLPEGQTLTQAMTQAFTRFNTHAGAFFILGGRLSVAAYHVATPYADSLRAVEYGPPTYLEGGADIAAATGSYGDGLQGIPLVHIHGALVAHGGRPHGGHFAPDLCVTGPGGIRVAMLLAVGFKQAVDRETRFSTFVPYSEVLPHGAN